MGEARLPKTLDTRRSWSERFAPVSGSVPAPVSGFACFDSRFRLVKSWGQAQLGTVDSSLIFFF
jgi:hypothetical protein